MFYSNILNINDKHKDREKTSFTLVKTKTDNLFSIKNNIISIIVYLNTHMD